MGAGSIIFQNNKLMGLTTAGGLWVTAGIGMAAGFGFFSLAFIVTGIIFVVLTGVNLIEKPIRRMSGEKIDDTIQN